MHLHNIMYWILKFFLIICSVEINNIMILQHYITHLMKHLTLDKKYFGKFSYKIR